MNLNEEIKIPSRNYLVKTETQLLIKSEVVCEDDRKPCDMFEENKIKAETIEEIFIKKEFHECDIKTEGCDSSNEMGLPVKLENYVSCDHVTGFHVRNGNDGCDTCKLFVIEKSHDEIKSCSNVPNELNSDNQNIRKVGEQQNQARPFACALCDLTFTTKCYLRKHIRRHAGQRPFFCNVCMKAFTNRTDLNRHYLIHTGEKAFICNVCNKAFTSKSNLNKHVLLHTGQRPFTCDICQKSFTMTSNLKQHVRVHTGHRPYSCIKCKKTFSYWSNLKQHHDNSLCGRKKLPSQ